MGNARRTPSAAVATTPVEMAATGTPFDDLDALVSNLQAVSKALRVRPSGPIKRVCRRKDGGVLAEGVVGAGIVAIVGQPAVLINAGFGVRLSLHEKPWP